ncbi:DUF5069 domain-containing protein [Haloferula sargassicola]|uniref:DUF5069 domain-containing protein n=1 Tax=Haloferula sargassicola TaxID=490096 RepID=A0ABP9USV3_9BACT
MHWNDYFLDLFSRCVNRYRRGERDFETYYDDEDLEFLRTIGHRKREFFDFVEDFCDEDQPSPTTALLVASIRREYFHVVMGGEFAQPTVSADNIPTFGDHLEGIHYLPRILAKARAKLRGELDPDLMFGCGGDRKFLRENGGIHPADFLREVWKAGDDDAKIAAWIQG